MNQTAQASYALMRASMQMFNKPQSELDEQQRNTALQQVNRELAIGKRLLDTDVAKRVIVPEAAVDSTLNQLGGRFDSEEEFEHAMEQNGLDKASLRQAITHELKIEAITEQLLGEAAEADEHEVEIYYYEHVDKFTLPETRTARHLLLTINEEYQENTTEAVEQRINTLCEQLREKPGEFHDLALKNSECPTALHGGVLERIKPGQLYPELDRQLFAMEEGEISKPLRSEVGWHILLCETIHPAQQLPFTEVREKLQQYLSDKKRRHHLKRWLQQGRK